MKITGILQVRSFASEGKIKVTLVIPVSHYSFQSHSLHLKVISGSHWSSQMTLRISSLYQICTDTIEVTLSIWYTGHIKVIPSSYWASQGDNLHPKFMSRPHYTSQGHLGHPKVKGHFKVTLLIPRSNYSFQDLKLTLIISRSDRTTQGHAVNIKFISMSKWPSCSHTGHIRVTMLISRSQCSSQCPTSLSRLHKSF